jgi:hypothetical protein
MTVVLVTGFQVSLLASGLNALWLTAAWDEKVRPPRVYPESTANRGAANQHAEPHLVA